MNRSDPAAALATDAYLYPPMALFEMPTLGATDAMRAVIKRCGALSGTTPSRLDSLKIWLATLLTRNDIAFYGSVLSDPGHAADADMLCFSPRAVSPTVYKPAYAHLYDMPDEQAFGYASLFVAGPLLFPDIPTTGLLMCIESVRSGLEQLPFLDGGMGELITHAAYKVLEGTDGAGPDGLTDLPRIRFTLTLQRSSGEYTAPRPYGPHELNSQIRDQMQELRDEGVHALTMAAMRRIRIKEEHRAGLADTFIKELRQKKVRNALSW